MASKLTSLGNGTTQYYLGFPVGCCFEMVRDKRFVGNNSDALWSMIMSEFLLFFSSITRCVKMFRTSSTKLEGILRRWPSKKIKEGLCFLDRKANGIETKATWLTPNRSRIVYQFSTSFLLLARAACDAMTSLLWEVCWPIERSRTLCQR